MSVTDKRRSWEAREEYVKQIATRHRDTVLDTMVTEVELTWSGEPYRRFRIFRSGKEWITVAHRPTSVRVLKDMGMYYEIQGEREDRSLTRESALGWIALHYQDVIDRMIEGR